MSSYWDLTSDVNVFGHWASPLQTDTPYDASGNSNDATWNGTPTYSDAEYGRAFDFGSRARYLVASQSLSDGLGDDIVVALRAKFEGSSSDSTRHTIMSDFRTASANGVAATEGTMIRYLASTNSFTFTTAAGGTSNSAEITSSILEDSNWHSLVFMRSGTTVSLYVDGSLVGSDTAAEDPDSTTSGTDRYLHIGRASHWLGATSGLQWDGELADILIHRGSGAAWSTTQVAEYDSGPEPTNSSAPSITGAIEVGETIDLSPGEWESFSNGVGTTSHVLQVSDDGVTGWVDVTGSLNALSFALSAAHAGAFLRVQASSTNDGGQSDPTESAVVEVALPRSPLQLAASDVGVDGIEAGKASAVGTAESGQVLA